MSSVASRSAVCFGVSAVSRSVGTRALRWLCLLLLTLSLCLRPALAQTDTAAPVVVSVTTPADGSLVTMLQSITGKAVDLGTENASASGVAQVKVQLARMGDAYYSWTGTQWGNPWQEHFLSTALSASTGVDAGKTLWQVTTPLPSGNDLTNGRYLIAVTAIDAAGNASGILYSYFYVGTKDDRIPVGIFTSPSPQTLPTLTNGQMSAPGQIEAEPSAMATLTGTLHDPLNSDGTTGSGLYLEHWRNNVTLFRAWGGQYEFWNGTSWVGQWSSLPLTMSVPDAQGQVSWSANTGLTPSNLPPGNYILIISGIDHYYNGGGAWWELKVLPKDTTLPTASVLVPSANASITHLSSISGTAHDPVGTNGLTSSGLANMGLLLQRYDAANNVWNTWNASLGQWGQYYSPLYLDAPLSGLSATWSVSQNLPGGVNLVPGQYQAIAQVFDRFHNESLNFSPFQVIPNTRPTAQGQSLTINGATPITLSATDAEGDTIESYRIVQSPAHGTLSGTAPNLTYTADAGYNGSDSFTFAASDWEGEGAPATVFLTSSNGPDPEPTEEPTPTPTEEPEPEPVPLNTRPVAQAQAVTATSGAATAITLTATDAEDDPIVSYRVVNQPKYGTLTGDAPEVVYTPDAGYYGSDSFVFAASDAGGEGKPSTVTLQVSPPTLEPLPTVTPTPDSGGTTSGYTTSGGTTGSSTGGSTPPPTGACTLSSSIRDAHNRRTDTCTISNLPAHSQLTVSFTLHLTGTEYGAATWDGGSTDMVPIGGGYGPAGPDTFSATAGGSTMVSDNFLSPFNAGNGSQSFAGPVSDTHSFTKTIAHSASSVTFTFVGDPKESPANEDWYVSDIQAVPYATTPPGEDENPTPNPTVTPAPTPTGTPEPYIEWDEEQTPVAIGHLESNAHKAGYTVTMRYKDGAVAPFSNAPSVEILRGGRGATGAANSGQATCAYDDEQTNPQHHTDRNGQIKGTFSSGKRQETTSIGFRRVPADASSGILNYIDIEQVWNANTGGDAWEYDEYFDFDTPSPVTYKMKFSRSGQDAGIDNHDLRPSTDALYGFEWDPLAGEDGTGDYVEKVYAKDDTDTTKFNALSNSIVTWGPVTKENVLSSAGKPIESKYTSNQTLHYNEDFELDSVYFWFFDYDAYAASGDTGS